MSKRKFRILAIDGGGIRGVVPLQIIRYIESITKEEIHKSFDLIAGTSTGGILTCALTLQDTSSIEANKRKYTLDDLERIYKERGRDIFKIPKYKITQGIINLRKWFHPQFNPQNLNSVLNEYFADHKITSCLKPILIASYDIHRNKPIIFTFREASIFPDRNSSLTEICRATSAAPTYFPTFSFNYDTENLTCIDGGIYMNNPALGALIEVLGNSDYKNYRIDDTPLQLEDISILSLGTGRSNSTIDSVKSKNWGRLKWIKPIIDLTTNGPVKVIHNQIETIFKSFGLESNYLRIDVQIDNKFSEMSDARPETINYLINKANSLLQTNETLKLKLHFLLQEAGILPEININNEETEQKNILILSATYEWPGGQVNVTAKIIELISNGIYTIMVDPGIFGIKDPAWGIVKTLNIHCKINGQEKVFIKKDGERFKLE